MKTRDVLGLGCTAIDELLFVESFPQPDFKMPVQSAQTQGGGLTATALVAAARLGARCAYGGMLGFDATSRQIVEIFEAEGITTDLVTWDEAAAAVRSIIIVDTTHHTRNIFFQRPAKLGASAEAPSEAEIMASRVLLIDHYGGQGNVRAIRLAQKNGVPVVADFERTNVSDWDEFFPLVDHLVLSRGFAGRLTGEKTPEAMLGALWNEHRRVVVVTCGREGCYALENGQVSHCPAFSVEVVDTTGCGDVFHGVYAATLAWEWPLEKRLQWATVAASLKAREVGAQKGIPHRAEIELHLG
jgi:sulfofructose kinase